MCGVATDDGVCTIDAESEEGVVSVVSENKLPVQKSLLV